MKRFNKQHREGRTLVTSVSIPKEFIELMKKHDISPSWAVRKGVAIELYERGVDRYQSETNKKRYEYIQKLEDQDRIYDKLYALQIYLSNIINEINMLLLEKDDEK